MRILMITNNWIPYSGGVVSSIAIHTQALQKLGHDVQIVTLDFAGSHSDPAYVHRVPFIAQFTHKKNPISIPWRMQQVVEQKIDQFKPDIIHVHHPFVLGQTGIKAARKKKIPVVFTYHSLYEAYAHYLWPLPHWLVAWCARTMSIRFADQVSAVIAPSPSIERYLKKYGVNKPICIMPSPIAPLFYGSTKLKNRINTPIKLIYVGRFAHEKNLFFLLDVLAMLTVSFECTFVGYGYAQQELEEYAYRVLGLSSIQIRFIIKPPKIEIARYYADADIKLFASQSETQGLVLVEAMIAGTPVVALAGSAVNDIVIDGRNGFLVDNKQSMVERIVQLIQDPKLHARLSQGARDTASRYHPSQKAQQLADFYRNIIVIQ